MLLISPVYKSHDDAKQTLTPYAQEIESQPIQVNIIGATNRPEAFDVSVSNGVFSLTPIVDALARPMVAMLDIAEHAIDAAIASQQAIVSAIETATGTIIETAGVASSVWFECFVRGFRAFDDAATAVTGIRSVILPFELPARNPALYPVTSPESPNGIISGSVQFEAFPGAFSGSSRLFPGSVHGVYGTFEEWILVKVNIIVSTTVWEPVPSEPPQFLESVSTIEEIPIDIPGEGVAGGYFAGVGVCLLRKPELAHTGWTDDTSYHVWDRSTNPDYPYGRTYKRVDWSRSIMIGETYGGETTLLEYTICSAIPTGFVSRTANIRAVYTWIPRGGSWRHYPYPMDLGLMPVVLGGLLVAWLGGGNGISTALPAMMSTLTTNVIRTQGEEEK